MTVKDAVLIVDPTAKVFTWSDSSFWAKGAGWETKITYSEARAWELAAEIIAASAEVING